MHNLRHTETLQNNLGSPISNPPIPNNPLSGAVDHLISTVCLGNNSCAFTLEIPIAMFILGCNYYITKSSMNNSSDQYQSSDAAKLLIVLMGLASMAFGVYAGTNQYHNSKDVLDQFDDFDVDSRFTPLADALMTCSVTTTALNWISTKLIDSAKSRFTILYNRRVDHTRNNGYIAIEENQTVSDNSNPRQEF